MTLELVNVIKKYHRFIVGPLSFKVSEDNILVIIGPTGHGKTTILNLIAGLIKPDSGTILLEGIDITNMPVELRNIGYTFQSPNLFPHLNVYQNITFGIKKRDKKDKERLDREARVREKMKQREQQKKEQERKDKEKKERE